MDNIFDGDAISRADREFLASLGEHPLRQNPRYGTPCPPPPDFGPFDPKDPAQTAARLAFFADVVTWMLANYAYREGAFVSKGGAISLVDGEIISLPDLRGRMAPWALLHIGPRGAIKVRSPVEDWMLGEGPALDPPRGDAARPAAADLRGGRLCDIQPLPAAGAPGDRRRARRRSRATSPGSSLTRRNGHGCGTGSPTRRAGRGCRWSR